MQLSWLPRVAGQTHYFAHYVLRKPAKGNNLGMPHYLPKIIVICQMFLKAVILICWCFRALCAGKTIHSVTDSNMSGMQRQWSWIQANVKCQASGNKTHYKSGTISLTFCLSCFLWPWWGYLWPFMLKCPHFILKRRSNVDKREKKKRKCV